MMDNRSIPTLDERRVRLVEELVGRHDAANASGHSTEFVFVDHGDRRFAVCEYGAATNDGGMKVWLAVPPGHSPQPPLKLYLDEPDELERFAAAQLVAIEHPGLFAPAEALARPASRSWTALFIRDHLPTELPAAALFYHGVMPLRFRTG